MRKKTKKSAKNPLHKWFIIIAVFWLVIILGFIGMKEFTFMTGKEVVLKTTPVDPRDIFRGDYVILRYEISTIDLDQVQSLAQNFEPRDTIYVILEEENSYGVPIAISHSEPKKPLFIKGLVKKVNENEITVEYGIESYFVPEGKGRDLERARGNELEVKVVIDAYGTALIKELFLEGKTIGF